MVPIHRMLGRLKLRQAKKYEHLLLCEKIHLRDVPLRFLRDLRTAPGLFIIAFRADRGISKEAFDADLLLMEREIEIAKVVQDIYLAEKLEQIKANSEIMRDYFFQEPNTT